MLGADNGSARGFSPEGVLPINEGVSRGGGVWCVAGPGPGGETNVDEIFNSEDRAKSCPFLADPVAGGEAAGGIVFVSGGRAKLCPFFFGAG